MDNKEFKVPAKPWGDKEIRELNANQEHLDKKTLKELGLDMVKDTELKDIGIKGHEPVRPELKTPETKEEVKGQEEEKDKK